MKSDITITQLLLMNLHSSVLIFPKLTGSLEMTEENIPEDAVSVVIEGAKIFIPLDELVDFSKELDRLNKEKAKIEGEIKKKSEAKK